MTIVPAGRLVAAVQVKVPSPVRKVLLLCQPLSVKLICVPEPTSTNNTKAISSGSSKLKPMMAMSPANKVVGPAAGVLVGVFVRVLVGVNVAVGVNVGVDVNVGVKVKVGVGVGVKVNVAVGVNVDVGVKVGVNVKVCVAVGVLVGAPPWTVKGPLGMVWRTVSLPVQFAVFPIAASNWAFVPLVMPTYFALSISFKAIALVPLTNPMGRADVLVFVASACHTPAPSLFNA